jgi:hypothetical protein
MIAGPTVWRYAIVGVLLVFAWRGSALQIDWPPADTDPTIPKPQPVLLEWSVPVRAIAATMLPKDREYLSNLYDAMAFVIIRDGKRENDAIISTTSKFVTFHAGTLQLAIDKANVGRYPGLGEAIDEVFVLAVGADVRALSEADRTKLVAACNVLAWTFKIHGE